MEIVSAKLRQVISDSGESRYAIAKATGVSQTSLSRFMARQATLGGAAIDALCVHFGLELNRSMEATIRARYVEGLLKRLEEMETELSRKKGR